MAFEMLVGLFVSDDQIYSEYRAAMFPILRRYGGGFRYDFKIAEVLKGEKSRDINRVFTIYFRDQGSRDLFFQDPEYTLVKQRFFDRSVRSVAVLAEYSRSE